MVFTTITLVGLGVEIISGLIAVAAGLGVIRLLDRAR